MNLPYYKEYIQRLRKLELDEVHLYVVDDTAREMWRLVLLILETEFEDGKIHSYYGKIKDIVSAYHNFWSETIEEAIVNTEKFCQKPNKDEALALVDRNISLQTTKQVDFGKEYLPVTTADEKQIYDSIEAEYHSYIRELHKIKAEVDEVAPRYAPAAIIVEKIKNNVKKLGELFKFTHTYIALFLADNLYRIRASLEENVVRVRKVLKDLKTDREVDINALVHDLYDRNKELLEIERRRDLRNSLALTEIRSTIERKRQLLEDHEHQKNAAIERVSEELQTWTDRIKEFEPIAHVLRSLKAELDNTLLEEKIYSEKRCLELPGSKKKQWELIGENLGKRKKYLHDKIVKGAKALMTFFHVIGPTMEIHKADGIGPFFYDDYGHQVYQLEYGLRQCHVTCDMDLIEITKHHELFAQDELGQYRVENGERIHQRSNCGSCYKLDSNGNLLERVSYECGHSKVVDAHCETKIRHLALPCNVPQESEKLSLKGKLDPETTKYIWDTFGHILPEALAGVANVKPKNPMKYLANRLLKLHYSWTKKETQKRKEASAKFKEDILSGRKEKLLAATLAWRDKHGKQPFTDDAVAQAQLHAMHYWMYQDN